MADISKTVPTALEILHRFYAAEQVYMAEPPDKRDFSGMAVVLASDVKLRQSPDLPFGGTYTGHDGYIQWAAAMAERFDKLEPQDLTVFEEKDGNGDTVILTATVLMRVRKTGREIHQLGVQVVKVDREREVIVEMRPVYWNVASLRTALEE